MCLTSLTLQYPFAGIKKIRVVVSSFNMLLETQSKSNGGFCLHQNIATTCFPRGIGRPIGHIFLRASKITLAINHTIPLVLAFALSTRFPRDDGQTYEWQFVIHLLDHVLSFICITSSAFRTVMSMNLTIIYNLPGSLYLFY